MSAEQNLHLQVGVFFLISPSPAEADKKKLIMKIHKFAWNLFYPRVKWKAKVIASEVIYIPLS